MPIWDNRETARDPLLASEITDPADIRLGADNLEGATPTSVQMSLAELGKAVDAQLAATSTVESATNVTIDFSSSKIQFLDVGGPLEITLSATLPGWYTLIPRSHRQVPYFFDDYADQTRIYGTISTAKDAEPRTYSFWYYPLSIGGGDRTLLDDGSSTNSGRCVIAQNSGYVRITNGSNIRRTTAQLLLNAWNLCTIVVPNGATSMASFLFFQNGEQVPNINQSGTSALPSGLTTSRTLSIGLRGQAGSTALPAFGRIRDVVVTDSEWDIDDHISQYTGGVPAGTPQYWLKLNEGESSSIANSGTSGGTFTQTANVTWSYDASIAAPVTWANLAGNPPAVVTSQIPIQILFDGTTYWGV